jgi:hypothetical protein
VPAYDFEQLLGGMRATGCSPTLMGSYQETGDGWFLTVRISDQSDERVPMDAYERPRSWETEDNVLSEEMVDGSRVRVYARGDLTGGPVGATRVDPDKLVVDIILRNAEGAVSMNAMRDLVAERELRF